MSEPLSATEIAAILRQGRYAFDDEHDLQAEIARHLTDWPDAVPVPEREVVLSPRDRIDLLAGTVGIEVKVDGSANTLRKQVARYLQSPRVRSLVIVTTRSSHRALETSRLPVIEVVHVSTMNGTRVHKPAGAGRLGSITFEDGTWAITAAPHVVMRVKRAFPRINLRHDGVLTITSTPEIDRDIEWIRDRWPLQIDPVDLARLERGADEHRATTRAVESILTGTRLTPADEWLEMAYPPRWGHQTTNADLITTGHRLLIGDDMGAGKTYSGLTAFRNPGALPAVVVCPTNITHQWIRQCAMFWPDLTAEIIPRGDWHPKGRDITVLPYSRLAKHAGTLAGARTVIFDEAHELRHGGKTMKGDAALLVAAHATYVVGLTGTPVYNYGGEIWNIMNIIRPGVLGDYDEFTREWGGKFVNYPAGLRGYLREIGAMVTASLPASDMVPVLHELDIDDDAVNLIDARTLAASILDPDTDRLTRFQNAGQLDMVVRQETGIAKAPYVAAFVAMLLETVDKVVLFGWHRAVYDTWLEQLAAFSPVMYTGTENEKQKDAAQREFIEGEARVLIMSLRSGEGLDGLQAVSSTAVFGELDWSPSRHLQCIKRLDRPGQAAGVVAYFLTSGMGSDPPMLDLLGMKEGQTAAFTAGAVANVGTVDTSGDRIRRLARSVLNG